MTGHQHGHQHGHQEGGHDQPIDEAAMFTREFWDERYAGSTRVWSGKPNHRLVEQAAGLTPGRAIDVGCGEGADVVWLAQQGWQVTGVDVSQVALDRAAAHAAEAGVAEQTSFARLDVVGGDSLLDALPGPADLVVACFMHPPTERFAATYGAALAAVAPGGRLLVVAHHPADAPTGLRNAGLTHLLFEPQRVLDVLDPDEGWEVEVAEAQTRPVETADGQPLSATDTVVRLRRRT
jgi:SAM-dependent methyltransferase